jgi:hypothetical protein
MRRAAMEAIMEIKSTTGAMSVEDATPFAIKR